MHARSSRLGVLVTPHTLLRGICVLRKERKKEGGKNQGVRNWTDCTCNMCRRNGSRIGDEPGRAFGTPRRERKKGWGGVRSRSITIASPLDYQVGMFYACHGSSSLADEDNRL